MSMVRASSKLNGKSETGLAFGMINPFMKGHIERYHAYFGPSDSLSASNWQWEHLII